MMLHWIIIMFFSAMMIFLPVAGQERQYGIEADYFKRIKIKKLSFLFRGIGHKVSAKEYGVIIPMFAVQLLGYVLAFCSITLAIVLQFTCGLELRKIFTIVAIILGVEIIIDTATIILTIISSRKRKKRLDNIYENQYILGNVTDVFIVPKNESEDKDNE